MARRSLPEKVRLMVNFLLGVRHSEVHHALVPYGWSAEMQDKGWRLVERAGRARFFEEEIKVDTTFAELLAFKKRWFSITRIALGRRYPEISVWLLGRPLASTQEWAPLVVGGFLAALAKLEESPNENDRGARELLSQRGLTEAVVKQTARLVERSATLMKPEKVPASLLQREAQAEDELWDFYVEWSGLARRAITNRSMLRMLGLYKPGRAPSGPSGTSTLTVSAPREPGA
jgi:hypothetical protein